MNHTVRNEACRSPPQSTKKGRSVPISSSPSLGKWDKTCAPPNRRIHLRNDVTNSFGGDHRGVTKSLSSDAIPSLPSALQAEMLQLIRMVLDNNQATLSCDTIRLVATRYSQQTKSLQEPVAPLRSVECDNDPSLSSDGSDLRDSLQVSYLTQITRKCVNPQAQANLCMKGNQTETRDGNMTPSVDSLHDTSSSNGAADQAIANIGIHNIPTTFDTRIHNLRRKRTRLESMIRTNVSKFGNGSMSSLDSTSLGEINGPVSVDMCDSDSHITVPESSSSLSRQWNRETLLQLPREAQHMQRRKDAYTSIEQQQLELTSTSATATLNETHTTFDNDGPVHELDDHDARQHFRQSTCQLRTSNRALIEHEYHNHDNQCQLSPQSNAKRDIYSCETGVAGDGRRWLFRFFHSLSFLIKEDNDDSNGNRSDESDHGCYRDLCNQTLLKDATVQLGQYLLDEPNRTTVEILTELERTQLETQPTQKKSTGNTLENKLEKDQCTKIAIEEKSVVTDEVCYATLLKEAKSEVSSLESANQAMHAELAVKHVSLEANKTELLDLEDLLSQIHGKIVKLEEDCGVDHISVIPDKLVQMERELAHAKSEIERLQYTLVAPNSLTTGTAELTNLNETCQAEREGCNGMLTTTARGPEYNDGMVTLSEEELKTTDCTVRAHGRECGVHNDSIVSSALKRLSTPLEKQLNIERTDLNRTEAQLLYSRIVELEKQRDECHVAIVANEEESSARETRCSQLPDEAMSNLSSSQVDMRTLETMFNRERKVMQGELSVKMTSLEEHKTKLVESQTLLDQAIRTLRELACCCGVGDVAAIPGRQSMTLKELSTIEKDMTAQLTKEREDMNSARLHIQLLEGRIGQLEQTHGEKQVVVSALESELRASDVRYSQLRDEANACAEKSQAELKSPEVASDIKNLDLIDKLIVKTSSLEMHESRATDLRELLEKTNQELRQLECDCGVEHASAIPGKLSMALERVASLEKDLVALTNERADLDLVRQESQTFQSRMVELEQQVGIGQGKISTLEEELRATEIRYFQMLEETQASVERNQTEYTSLEKAFEDMKNELDIQQSIVEDHKTTQMLLMTSNQTLRQLVQDCGVDDSSQIPEKLFTSMEKVFTLEKALATLTNERADLTGSLVENQLLKSRISELERQCDQYQATTDTNRAKSCETESRYTELLEEAKASAETSRAELKSLELLHQGESHEMKVELAFKMSSLNEHKTKLVESRALLEQANRQLKELACNCEVDDVSTIPGKLVHTTEQLFNVETELAKAQDEIVCLQKEVKVLSAKISLATGQAELKSLEKAFHAERQEWQAKLDVKDQRLMEEQRVLLESQEQVEHAKLTLRELIHDCGVDSISHIPYKLSSAQERLNAFENDLEQARCKILRLEHDIDALNNTNSVSHAHQQATSFEKKYKVAERMLNKTTTEIDSLKQTLARLYTKWESSGEQSVKEGIENPVETYTDNVSNCPRSDGPVKQLQIKLDQAQAEMQYLVQTKLEQQSQYSVMQALQWDLEEERNYNRLKLAQFEKLVNMRHSPTALEMQLRETSLLFAEVQASKDTLQLQIYRLQAEAKTLQCELFQKNKVIQVLGSRLELTPDDYLETLQIEQDEMLRRATDLSVELAESHMQMDEMRERLRQKDKAEPKTEKGNAVVTSSSNSLLDDYRPVPSILSSFRIGMDFRR